MSRILAIILFVVISSSVCQAAEPLKLNDPKDKNSYTLGYTFGKNMKESGVDLKTDTLLEGIRDGLEAKVPVMGQDEMRETLTRLEEQMRIARQKITKESSAKNIEEGKAFLDKNKEKQGVKTFPDGLQYKVLSEGSGPTPSATDTVTVNYRGSLIDGTLFDSSYTRGEPTTLRVDGVIPGWTEALQHMKTGAKWQIFVPPELGYGARPNNRIPPNSTLIFEIELLSIAKDSQSKSPEQSPPPEPNKGGKASQ